jgi:hypothetical protein
MYQAGFSRTVFERPIGSSSTCLASRACTVICSYVRVLFVDDVDRYHKVHEKMHAPVNGRAPI